MKRKLFLAASLATLALALLPAVARAQAPQFELTCPAGSSPAPAGQAYNPQTGKYRQFECISDINGTATWNDAVNIGGGGGVQGPGCTGATSTQLSGNGLFNPCTYGAIGDAFTNMQCSVTASTTPTVTCPNANFPLTVATTINSLLPIGFLTGSPLDSNTNPAGGVQCSVASRVSATQVKLQCASATSSVSNTAVLTTGHDDTAALNATFSACELALEAYISGCTVTLPCQGFLVQQAVAFPTALSTSSTVFGENVISLCPNDGTTSILTMTPTFNFTAGLGCAVLGCFFRMTEAYYGQDLLQGVSIYQGGYSGLAPAAGLYLIVNASQAITRDTYIEGNFNNAHIGGFECYGSICEYKDIQCYGVDGICLNVADAGARVTITGGMSFLQGSDAIDIAPSAVVISEGYNQFVGGTVAVRFNGASPTLIDDGGSFGGGVAGLYSASAGATADMQNDYISANAATQGVVSVTGGSFVLSARNTSFVQLDGSGTIFGQTGGTATFNDLGGNRYTGGSSSVVGTLSVTRNFSADSVLLATSNVGLTSGWDTGSVSAAAGNSHIGQFTIAMTGTGGATPTVTLTFPTAYPLVAPLSCAFQQIGGTFGTLTNPTPSALGKTSVLLTLTGTPIASNNYIFSYQCGP